MELSERKKLILKAVIDAHIEMGEPVGSKYLTQYKQIAYSSADQVIPIEIISQNSDYVRLFVVIGAVILICMVVLGVLISKIKISRIQHVRASR